MRMNESGIEDVDDVETVEESTVKESTVKESTDEEDIFTHALRNFEEEVEKRAKVVFGGPMQNQLRMNLHKMVQNGALYDLLDLKNCDDKNVIFAYIFQRMADYFKGISKYDARHDQILQRVEKSGKFRIKL